MGGREGGNEKKLENRERQGQILVGIHKEKLKTYMKERNVKENTINHGRGWADRK